jgi:hypothetical protein
MKSQSQLGYLWHCDRISWEGPEASETAPADVDLPLCPILDDRPAPQLTAADVKDGRLRPPRATRRTSESKGSIVAV